MIKPTLTPTDEHLFHIQAAIDRDGYSLTYVIGDRRAPDYAYTVGFLLHGHPELAVVGLAPESTAGLVRRLFDEVCGGRSRPIGIGAAQVLDGVPIRLLPVPGEHWRAGGSLLGGIACYFAGIDRPLPPDAAVQVVWPDGQGCFPWDDDVDHLVWRDQPVLALGDAPRRREPLLVDPTGHCVCDECLRAQLGGR